MTIFFGYFPGVGLAGSFKLVPQKPVQVKKITKPKVQSGGKIKIAKITADVYGSSTNAQPMEAKPKTVKKVGLKKNTNNKEDIKENVDPPTKKGKAGPKKDTVVKKPKEATVKTKEATTKPEKATTKSKGETAKPKQAIKRGASKKEEELSQDDHNEEVPKKIRKPVPKKIVAPKAPEVAAKKITVSKKVPSKTTVVAIRKSLDGDKKMIAVSRPKRKG